MYPPYPGFIPSLKSQQQAQYSIIVRYWASEARRGCCMVVLLVSRPASGNAFSSASPLQWNPGFGFIRMFLHSFCQSTYTYVKLWMSECTNTDVENLMSENLHLCWNSYKGVPTLMLTFWCRRTYIYVEILMSQYLPTLMLKSWSADWEFLSPLMSPHVPLPVQCTSKCDIWQLCLSLISAVVTRIHIT